MITKMERARAHMVQSQTFFATLALRLKMQPSPAVETMDVDGTTLRYNEAWVEATPLSHVIAVTAHEAVHCAAGHPFRFFGRDPDRWNRSCDYNVNLTIRDAGFDLPPDAFIDERFKGMSADAIYVVLDEEERPPPADQPEEQPEEDDADGDDAGESGGGEDEPGEDEGDGSESESEPGEGTEGEGRTASVGGCGSMTPAPAEDGSGKPASPAEMAAKEHEWQVATMQAANAAKAAGDLPGAAADLAQDVKRGLVDWREELRRFFQRVAKTDYRMVPPNRRLLPHGLVLPSMRSEQIGEIVLAFDRSASITRKMKEQFAAEINAIVADCGPERVHVLYFDTAVQRHDTFEPDDFPFEISVDQGGGTYFPAVFKYIEDEGIEPAAFVMLTDLESVFPDVAPEYPVLFASTDEHGTAPFGDVVPLAP